MTTPSCCGSRVCALAGIPAKRCRFGARRRRLRSARHGPGLRGLPQMTDDLAPDDQTGDEEAGGVREHGFRADRAVDRRPRGRAAPAPGARMGGGLRPAVRRLAGHRALVPVRGGRAWRRAAHPGPVPRDLGADHPQHPDRRPAAAVRGLPAARGRGGWPARCAGRSRAASRRAGRPAVRARAVGDGHPGPAGPSLGSGPAARELRRPRVLPVPRRSSSAPCCAAAPPAGCR